MKMWRFFDPDDPGGAGAGDPEPEPGGNGEDKKKVVEPSTAEAVKAVADSIKQAIEAARVPVAAPVAIAPTPIDHRSALEAEAERVNAQFDELVTAGKASEAWNLRQAFERKAANLLAPKMEDRLDVKVAVQTGERIARATHPDLMKRWGDEIKRAVDSMPLDQRVLPDAWDRAVAQVKTNHVDELIQEAVTGKVEEAKKSFVPPPSAGGNRGARPADGAASKLTEEQLWGADLCGISPEAYVKQLKAEEEYDKLPVKVRGAFGGYPVVGQTREGDKIAPGKF